MPVKLIHKSMTAMAVIAAFLLVLTGGLSVNSTHPLVNLLVAVLVAGGTAFYLGLVSNTIRQRQPEPWQLAVAQSGVVNRWVSQPATKRICHLLHGATPHNPVREDKIILITHRHVIYLIKAIWLPVLLALVLLYVLLFVGTFRIHVGLTNQVPAHPKQLTHPRPVIHTPTINTPINLKHLKHWLSPKHNQLMIPWWLSLAALGVCLLIIWCCWLPWGTWFLILTNDRIIILQLPYAGLPFSGQSNHPFFVSSLKTAQYDGSAFRVRYALAKMSVTTYMNPDEDAPLQNIKGLPKVDRIVEIINGEIPIGRDEKDRETRRRPDELTQLVSLWRPEKN